MHCNKGILKMKPALSIAAFMAFVPFAGASAQTAEFRCPAPGTEFTYQTGGASSVTVATGQDGNTCLTRNQSDGRTKDVKMHWGLIGSVDAAGDSYARGVDLKSLWPLKVGNKTRQTITATGHEGGTYTADVTMTVAAYEKVAVPAGTFDVFRVEEHKAGEATPHIHCWAPALAFSIKETFPDWTDRTKLKTYELTATKPAQR
jgi:hypothetical protein